jgi:serine/threonine protein phosphatase PrpC
MAIVVPRFDFRIECSAVTDLGKVRSNNEDAYLCAPELGVFAVADGMGGHAAGEIAAKLAIEEVREAVASERAQRAIDQYVAHPDLETRRKVFHRLRRIVERANERVRTEAAAKPEYEGMGCTLDVVWLARNYAFVAHAGDGRVYLARARTVLQLTQDHGQLESLKATGMVRPQKQSTRNALINAVGLSDTITVDTLFVDLARKDRLLLSSDGVHGQIPTESELAELLRGSTAERAAQALIDRAGQRGQDNATAVVIEIDERFVRREELDRGLGASDLERARQSPLLMDLPRPLALGTLAAAVEIELDPGSVVPRVLANDLVAYIVLEGVVSLPDKRQVSNGALVFPESLVGVWGAGELPVVDQTARLLRLRFDDFQEVCQSPALGAELYRRLALHIARAQPGAAQHVSTRPPARFDDDADDK